MNKFLFLLAHLYLQVKSNTSTSLPHGQAEIRSTLCSTYKSVALATASTACMDPQALLRICALGT
jgi:hypothetical protein